MVGWDTVSITDLPPAKQLQEGLVAILMLAASILTRRRDSAIVAMPSVCEDGRMTLRDLRRRLTASLDELHHEQLREQWSAHATTPIEDVQVRTRVQVGGEVQGVQVVPRVGSPSLEVRVHDGTGKVTAVFTGRRSLGGMAPGRRVVLEGFVQTEGNRLVLMNPGYTLLA